MALADIMSVERSTKYMDSSSSSSLSSDSDNFSSSMSSTPSSSGSESESDTAQSSVKKEMSQERFGKSVAPKVSNGDNRVELGSISSGKEKKKQRSTNATAPKRSPVKNSGMIKKTTKTTSVTATPPSPPPHPPPLPPPTSPNGNSSSNGSLSDSSSYSSDSETGLPSPPPTSNDASRPISSMSRGLSKRRAAGSKKVSGVNPSSLKVTLKLPPGFVAKTSGRAGPGNDQSKVNFQKTDPVEITRDPFLRTRNAIPALNPSVERRKLPTSGQCFAVNAATPPSTNEPHILPKLIPTGPTVPDGEIRGSRELALIDPAFACDRPEETIESDIPMHFNDPNAQGGDVLRLLDMFFFCDEDGKAISLEILDRPKDQRPKIMGFGTVVEHLPIQERPIPVKPILASPAFPSRSKKRPRAASSSAKTSSSRPRTRVKGADVKRAKTDDEDVYQGDGEFEEGDNKASVMGERGIFNRSTVYYLSGLLCSRHVLQMDGQSNSDSDLTIDNESNRSDLMESGACSDNDSELLSSGSSSSESGSENDVHSNKFSSSKKRSSESGAEMKKVNQRLSRRVPRTNAAERLPVKSEENRSPPVDRTVRQANARVDSRSANLPSEVVELMRTDQAVEVNAKGTPDELNIMECGFRHPSNYARARVWLPEITDWCLDYAEGDPTLWVITPHAWYKIAGPLSGLLPHPSYRHVFEHVRLLFEASYLVAYVLKEWLPINKKVSYRATLQQIIELSLKGRYRVSAWFLVKNYPFIRAQVCNLFSDEETYLESMFFKQLHRLHKNYTLRVARHEKEMAEREVRRAKRENERLQKKQRDEVARQRLKDERDEERKLKEEEHKYPMEDLRLLEGDAVHANILPLKCSSLKGIEGPLLGELIMVWQTICTFQEFVGLESISLEALVDYITTSSDKGTHIGLAEIFIAFLKVILSEKSFMSLLDDFVVEGNIKVSDLFVNCERTYGMCERAYGDMLSAVTWQEILRQLMSKDLGIDPSIGHVEPLVGCEIVRQTLYMQNNSTPFNAPVDTSIKGLEDYPQIIKKPMDLGTIKTKIDTGGYEGPDGHDNFAADVRLVWDNALQYNGEDSEVGKAALALSDVFEQDYARFVVGRIRANKCRIEECEKAQKVLKEPSARDLETFQYLDVVYGLYCFEFHQLPKAYKIGALSWICSEFLTLDKIRVYMASQVEQEMQIYRKYRNRSADLDSRRKHSDRMRRERENAFRRDCASQGIHPNSHNVFSDGIKRRHEFIGKFFEDIQTEKIEDEKSLEKEKKVQAEAMVNELSSIVIRESPLGKDRYHNSYYIFRNDSKARLFIERSDSGDFVVCDSTAQLTEILDWLNPKGIRELNLLTKLQEVKDKLIAAFEEVQVEGSSESVSTIKNDIELQMFPLRGGAIKNETLIIRNADKFIDSQNIARKMLLCLEQHLANTGTVPASWEKGQSWSNRVEEAILFKEHLDLFAELESAAVVTLNSGVETIRPSWKRKRHEWRLALEGSCTYAQLVFLLHLLLEEFLNVEAFLDLHIRLNRREWLKLRPKETHNFIPEEGKVVVYFGEGHALALKEDEKTKKKRFTQKSDTPVQNATIICTVKEVSYHHGGGDPYALAVLQPVPKMAQHECIRTPGTLLCPLPSREQRLARVFLRILAKLKMHADADPFLEPVSDREFPQYKEIIMHPMDLGKMTKKASELIYKSAAEFMTDLRLMRDNCQLFCEGRFPTLPPLAHNLLNIADAQIKKWSKEIRACENNLDEPLPLKPSPCTKPDESKMFKGEVPMRPIVTVLRLENRLPEYVVDVNRYSWAVNRVWHCGEKFRMLFRNPQGQPGEYYGGVTAGSLPFDNYGMLPWESLRITWDEDDGSDDLRINPWEAEFSSK